MIDWWEDVHWSPVELESPALDDYLRELRRTHAGVFVGRWRAQSYSEVAAWFAARNRLEEYEMHRLFFDSPSVRSKLRDLHIPAHLDAVSDGLGEVPGVESCRVVYEHRG